MADRSAQSRETACPHQPTHQQSQQQSTTVKQPEHPFIAFKHFVDDQFRAITQLTSFSDLRQKMQAASEAQALRDSDAHYLWTGRDVSPDHDEMVVQRMDGQGKNAAFDATLMLVREASKRNAAVDPRKIEALYHDNEFLALEHERFAGPLLSFGGACYYMPETSDNLPSTASLFGRWPLPAPRFLSIDWFKDSVYSPVNLEDSNPHYLPHAWRRAFEDLLCETLSKPCPRYFQEGHRPNYPHNVQSPWSGPGLDWMLSLYCRGILPPHPSLLSIKGRDNYGVLEHVRQTWPSLAGSWAPSSAEKEFADLTRAVASPPPDPGSGSLYRPRSRRRVFTAESLRRDEFFEELRSNGRIFSSPEAYRFWKSIYAERIDDAAEQIIAWERLGRYVEDLIDDDKIRMDYIFTDTAPKLWPLCEALEKAQSELWVLQDEERLIPLVAPSPAGDREELESHIARLEQQPKTEKVSQITAHLSPPRDRERIDSIAKIEQPKTEEAPHLAAHPSPPRDGELTNSTAKIEQPKTEEVPHLAAQAAPGILSALTTTQTTRMPDGTVTTKVVLKKRFADGREETTESVKVEYPEQAADAKDGSSKPRGWFWS